MNDWQSWTALGIVGLTAVLYLRALLRRRKPSCGNDCSCGNRGTDGLTSRGSDTSD